MSAFRLWRGKGTASQVELAAQMLTTLTAAFPGRMIHGAGDAAFHGEALPAGHPGPARTEPRLAERDRPLLRHDGHDAGHHC